MQKRESPNAWRRALKQRSKKGSLIWSRRPTKRQQLTSHLIQKEFMVKLSMLPSSSSSHWTRTMQRRATNCRECQSIMLSWQVGMECPNGKIGRTLSSPEPGNWRASSCANRFILPFPLSYQTSWKRTNSLWSKQSVKCWRSESSNQRGFARQVPGDDLDIWI